MLVRGVSSKQIWQSPIVVNLPDAVFLVALDVFDSSLRQVFPMSICFSCCCGMSICFSCCCGLYVAVGCILSVLAIVLGCEFVCY